MEIDSHVQKRNIDTTSRNIGDDEKITFLISEPKND